MHSLLRSAAIAVVLAMAGVNAIAQTSARDVFYDQETRLGFRFPESFRGKPINYAMFSDRSRAAHVLVNSMTRAEYRRIAGSSGAALEADAANAERRMRTIGDAPVYMTLQRWTNTEGRPENRLDAVTLVRGQPVQFTWRARADAPNAYSLDELEALMLTLDVLPHRPNAEVLALLKGVTIGDLAGFDVEPGTEASAYFRPGASDPPIGDFDPTFRMLWTGQPTRTTPRANDIYLVQDLDASFWLDRGSAKVERKELKQHGGIYWYEYAVTGVKSENPDQLLFGLTLMRLEIGKPRTLIQMLVPVEQRAVYEARFRRLAASFAFTSKR